ncbi:MAG: substrate-binding domain-containing protein [Pseudomonadota bacterium]
MTKLTIGVAAAAIAVAGMAGSAAARDQIRIVGSSTVFPFATAVAENFGKAAGFPTPVVESTGSGGGLKLFCAGVGTDHPDITNASRRMKTSEFDTCQANGVTDITEVFVGYDGIVVANDKSGPDFTLTREQLFKALVKGQGEPANWSDVDPSLPAIKIEVLGPPPSSGTRDAFEELALEEGCEEAGASDDVCDNIEVRDDGAYVDAGENDNLIVQKLQANSNAVGVFGYSFLEENAGALKGATVGGVEPTFDNILTGDYSLSRTMYFYVKNAHVGVVPGIMEYVAEFVSEDASANGGYLVERGLIPLDGSTHTDNAEQAMTQKKLTKAKLEGKSS